MSAAFFIAMFDVTQIKLPQDRTEADYLLATYPQPTYTPPAFDSDSGEWIIYDSYSGDRVNNPFPNDFDLTQWQTDSFEQDLWNNGIVWITGIVNRGVTDDVIARSPTAQARGIHNLMQWVQYVYGPGAFVTDPRNNFLYYVPDNGNVHGANAFDLGLAAPDPIGNIVLAALIAAAAYGAYLAATGTTLTSVADASISAGADTTTASTGASVGEDSNIITFDDGSTLDLSTGEVTPATDTGAFDKGYIDPTTNYAYNPDGSVYDMSTGEQITPPSDANPIENVPTSDVQDVTQSAQSGTPVQAPVQNVPAPPVKATPSILQQLGINPSQLITTATGAVIRYVTTGNVNGVPQYRATPVRLPNGQYAYVGANGQVIGGAAPSGFGSLSSFFSSAGMPLFIGASLLLTLALSGKKG